MDDEIELMIEDCMKRETKLNEWERRFIQSISEQTYKLTDNQLNKLETIWERVTA